VIEEINPFKVIEATDPNSQEIRDIEKEIIDLKSNRAATDDEEEKYNIDAQIATLRAKIAKLKSD